MRGVYSVKFEEFYFVIFLSCYFVDVVLKIVFIVWRLGLLIDMIIFLVSMCGWVLYFIGEDK